MKIQHNKSQEHLHHVGAWHHDGQHADRPATDGHRQTGKIWQEEETH